MEPVSVALTRREFIKALRNVYGAGACYPFEMFNPCDDMDHFSFSLAQLEMKFLGPLWITKAEQKVRNEQEKRARDTHLLGEDAGI